jgi:SagB-type dehydrogenase family enzyme
MPLSGRRRDPEARSGYIVVGGSPGCEAALRIAGRGLRPPQAKGATMRNVLWMGLFMLGITGAAGAADETEPLPPPRMEGGMPLMQALQARHSTREFSTRPVPAQMLSDLLWAAGGVNRPESGKRTAPSARDWREIEIYVVTAGGVQLYLPESHALRRVTKRDVRATTGRQDYPGTAPLNLVFVANYQRMADADAEQMAFYAAADTGFMAQNVYLYCASAGLGAVVRGAVDREPLALALGLGPHQHITLAQTVGYPGSAK